MPPSSRASGTPSMAERRSFASRAGAAGRPGPGGAAGRPRPGGAAGSVRRTLGLSPRRGAKGGDEEWSGGDEEWNGGDEEWSSGGEAWSGGEAARRPWEAGQPAAAATLLARCLAAGAVTQETLDLTCRKAPCFVKFSEMEKMANIQAEINEKKLKTEILQLEKETADIAHPFYLGKKCEILQDMNRHLEAILKEKRALRKRLIKPRCQDSLPIEATFHKYVVELLTEAVTFIEKLESHVQAVRSIPQIPNVMKNMDTALTKTEVLMMELEELAEQILKWREQQKVYSDSICSTAELDFDLSLT
ncbi:HAUS augmin-like complex subunit 2 [Accipiter gentilis]|uniref:HAUS augmin-like complex subunit 2 n=1 Tax=Astur gentilis TaxID=8957 RepID=UPI002110816B|nr:HAUS augmin-like complex subunit 2 [Accipiter gentilis]